MPRESGETVAQAARRHFARQGHRPSRWSRYVAKFKEGRAEAKAERKTPAGKLWRVAVFVWFAGFFGGYDALTEGGRPDTWGKVAIAAAWPLVIAFVIVRDDYRKVHSENGETRAPHKSIEPLRT